ncbi:MAG: nucleotidyltransferase domain-containing protein [Nitrospirae bacterium]|nr:nucleotidyltransferase domain-containing protein [Nitrospirota bacterium]
MITLEEELRNIVREIEKNYNPEKIILFGSLTSESVKENSDIDLVVIKSTELDPWSRAKEVDRSISHAIPVDVLVYTPEEIEDRLKINDFFVKEILDKGIVVYER